MKTFCEIACLTIAAAASLVLKADYKFSAITNAATGATATTILVPDGSPVATSNMVMYVTQEAVKEAVQTAVSISEQYTDQAISEGGGGSGTPLKVATGLFVPYIDYSPLYDGPTNGASQVSGCYLTNVVLNTTNGYPQSLTVHLNGTICGSDFTNEIVNLTNSSVTNSSDNYAEAEFQHESDIYNIKYYTITGDIPYRGWLAITCPNKSLFQGMYSFTDNREFTNIISEVDTAPSQQHNRSLITSKAVYEATFDKIKRTGDTMLGDLRFSTSDFISRNGWRFPRYNLYGPLSFALGSSYEENTYVSYNAGMSVGMSDANYRVKFPAALWVERTSTNPLRRDRWFYDQYGIAYESQRVIDNVWQAVDDHRLSFPTNETGAMLDGTIARLEDFEFTNSIYTAVKAADDKAKAADDKATATSNGFTILVRDGVKNPFALELKSSGTTISTYNGDYARSLNFSTGLSVSQQGATTTVNVDSSKYATVDNLSAVKKDMERYMSLDSEKTIHRVFSGTNTADDTVTAIYGIRSVSSDYELRVAVSTVNKQLTENGASFTQIDNPEREEGSGRGWMKAEYYSGVGGTTNWTLYVDIGTDEPTWVGYNTVTITNQDIFPMEKGEQTITWNRSYYVRKIDQFRGAVSGYLSGDGSLYSIAGVKTNAFVTVSTMTGSIDKKVNNAMKYTEGVSNMVEAVSNMVEELYWSGTNKTDVINNPISFREGCVSFNYANLSFEVITNNWPNYKPVFICGSVSDGVGFPSYIKFSGFVNANGTIAPASASTIPRNTLWYGYIRRIDDYYYIEYIGTCE